MQISFKKKKYPEQFFPAIAEWFFCTEITHAYLCIWRCGTIDTINHLEVMHCLHSLPLYEILYRQVKHYLIFFLLLWKDFFYAVLGRRPSQANLITLKWAWFDYFTVDESICPLWLQTGKWTKCGLYRAMLTGGIKYIKSSASSFYCDILDILIDIMDECQDQYS